MTLCNLCPRACGISRKEKIGYCKEGPNARIARAALHFWEEPPISGQSGSGTVFFTGCSLRCVYCQNREISNGNVGREVSVTRLAEIFLELQEKGALNINLVTATHFADKAIEAISLARDDSFSDKPLCIPIVYNTSGYESVETIQMLEGFVDAYLTDFKYASTELAGKLSKAPDYLDHATMALDAMYELVGAYMLGEDPRYPEFRTHAESDVLKSGIVVRHLLLPGHLDDSKNVVKILANKPFADDIKLSLMSQYTPLGDVSEYAPELVRRVSNEEYEELIDYALDVGFDDCFIQEGEAAQESFIPAFDYEGV